MRAFAAICILSTALAFDISAIRPLDLNVQFTTVKRTKPAAIAQVKAVPAVEEADGYKEMITELAAQQKACASDAVTACQIEPEVENVGFNLGGLLDGVSQGFDDLLVSNSQIETAAIDQINDNTNAKIDAQIAAANKQAKSQLINDVSFGKINVSKLNKIHEAGGETIKDTSEQNSDKVAEVSKEAAVVDIINKAAQSNLVKDLVKASVSGVNPNKILAAADAPVVLDASDIIAPKAPDAPLFGAGFGGGFDQASLYFDGVADKATQNQDFDFGGAKTQMPDMGQSNGFEGIDWGNKFEGFDFGRSNGGSFKSLF